MGDSYTISFTNFDGNLGETEDPVTREIMEHGTPPATLVFDGNPETAGGIIVRERATQFAGIPGGIPAVNQTGIDGQMEFDLTIWENAGEIIEFDFRTVDGGWVADEIENSAMTIRGLDWANSDPGSFPTFFSEFTTDQGDFFLYYTIDGVPVTGYEIQQDIGLLVGPHPFDPNIPEVVYIAYSDGQVNEIAARSEGSIDLTYGSTQLDVDQGSWELLAFVVGVADKVDQMNGMGVGFLLDPPAGDAVMIPGDVNLDGVFDVNDFDEMGRALRDGLTASQYDVDGNGTVNAEDRTHQINVIGNTYIGDANFDGEFNSGDFVIVFQAGQYEDGVAANSTWATGDWNGDTEFDSGDFVAAFQAGGFEQGPRAAVQSVPEPASSVMAAFGLLVLGAFRRWRS
jgi:hypothetical protein